MAVYARAVDFKWQYMLELLILMAVYARTVGWNSKALIRSCFK